MNSASFALFTALVSGFVMCSFAQTIYQNTRFYNSAACTPGSEVIVNVAVAGLCSANVNPAINGTFYKVSCSALGAAPVFEGCYDSACTTCNSSVQLSTSCDNVNLQARSIPDNIGYYIAETCDSSPLKLAVVESGVLYNGTCDDQQTLSYAFGVCTLNYIVSCDTSTSLTVTEYENTNCTGAHITYTLEQGKCYIDTATTPSSTDITVPVGALTSDIPAQCLSSSTSSTSSTKSASTSSTSTTHSGASELLKSAPITLLMVAALSAFC